MLLTKKEVNALYKRILSVASKDSKASMRATRKRKECIICMEPLERKQIHDECKRDFVQIMIEKYPEGVGPPSVDDPSAHIFTLLMQQD